MLKKLFAPSALNSPLGRSATFFFVLISLAVLATNGWTLWGSWQKTLEGTKSQSRNLSVSLARQAEDTFLQAEITLADVVRDINTRGDAILTTPIFRQQLVDRYSKLPQLRGLFVYDAKGNWMVTTSDKVPAGANNSDREYFIYHRNHTDELVHIGSVVRSRSSGDLIIPVSLRLTDANGNFNGVALATISIDYFKHFYNYYELGPHDLLGLIMTDGTLLYVRPFPDSVINKKFSSSPLFTEGLKTTDSGSAIWRSAIDGVVRIYGYSRLKRYPLVVSAGYSRNEIWQQWMADHIVDAVLNILLLLVILTMGISMLRQVKTNVKNQFELTHIRDELEMINHTLQSLALVDGLTGLANRRQFDIFLKQSLRAASTAKQSLSLLMIDIDFFKGYNDTYGHVAGDECLKRVGAAFKHLPLRNTDLVARYGGEEFAIVLPATSTAAAQQAALNALNAIRQLGIIHEATAIPDKVVTISVGVYTAFAEGISDEAERFKENADQALYDAKRNGRNRIEIKV